MSAKPPRLLLRKSNKKPIIAAYVQEGDPVVAADELELVAGPGLAATNTKPSRKQR